MSADNAIDMEAATWVIRHRAGPLDADDQARFEAWRSADVRHDGAFIRLNAVQVDLERLSALSHGAFTQPIKHPQSHARSGTSRRAMWALAASMVAAVGIWALWAYAFPTGERYVSGVGELRQIALLDGTHMTLNTATKTRVEFGGAMREVDLSQGEAWFDIAKDSLRPFIVRAGNVTIKALGTAFAVKFRGENVDVIVTSGSVEVVNEAAKSAKPKHLVANERVTATDVGLLKVEPLSQEAIARSLAWRQGMVVFNGESLAEAAAVLNRHSHKRLTISDPAIAARPIVGAFHADDIESFARTAAAVTGAEIVAEDSGLRLQARDTH